MHLLLVEDDLELGAEWQRALAGHGLTSEWVRGVRHARALTDPVGADDEPGFACALLDLGLPDGDGLELLAHWRRIGLRLPVIVLSARDALAARVSALDMGADDYVIKPCEPIEIASRVRAVVRRCAGQAATQWTLGSLRIDTGRREVHLAGDPIALTPREYQVLVELARQAGQTVTKHRLARALSPLGDPMAFSALEWHVHHLRRKIGESRLRTVRGVGYCLLDDH